jgi:hypothetical protein
MDLKELQKEVIEFRDARDWEQFERQRSEPESHGASGLQRSAAFVTDFGVPRRAEVKSGLWSDQDNDLQRYLNLAKWHRRNEL